VKRHGAGLAPTPFLILRFLAVLVGMRLRGLIGMHSRLALVAGGSVSVVSGLLMLTSLVLLSGLVVMLGGFAAMHRRFLMVFGSFLGHGFSSGIQPDHSGLIFFEL
jgi:hypothetical protein